MKENYQTEFRLHSLKLNNLDFHFQVTIILFYDY